MAVIAINKVIVSVMVDPKVATRTKSGLDIIFKPNVFRRYAVTNTTVEGEVWGITPAAVIRTQDDVLIIGVLCDLQVASCISNVGV